MPNVGMPEILIILAIALLIFGPKALPKLGKSLGDSLREFRGAGKALIGDDEPDDERKEKR